jgi:hypothetical protein
MLLCCFDAVICFEPVPKTHSTLPPKNLCGGSA